MINDSDQPFTLRLGKTKSKPEVKALVRPVLDTHSIDKVQRRAARWVANRFRQTCSVAEMLADLSWPSLAERRKGARLSAFYKFHHGLTSINTKYPPTASRPKRSSRLSHSQSYDIPFHRTTYRQKSFFPRTIPEWNSLPEATVTAPFLEGSAATHGRSSTFCKADHFYVNQR